jgi:hypothetical protein
MEDKGAMNYTPEQYAAKLDAAIKKLESGDLIQAAVSSAHAEMAVRIFEEGKRGTGAKIGKYNTTTPLYISPISSPKKKITLRGKYGKTKFKNGKPHVTGYFKSYASFRNTIGRQTAFVDLNLSGEMQRDFAGSLTKLGPWRYQSGFKRNENTLKFQGLYLKYGADVFKTSKEEKDLLTKSIYRSLVDLLK